MASRTAPLRVAAAQVGVRLGDLDANVAKHLEMLDLARRRGANVVVFPELSLTGYDVAGCGPDLALGVDDARLRELAEAAGDLFAVVGYVEEGHGAQFFNSACALHRGEVVFNHRKLNLATYGSLHEGKFFASGRHVEAFPLPHRFTGSVLVCADTWNPALVQLAALQGSTLLLVPTNSARDAISSDFSSVRGWETVLRFHAMVLGLPIVFANRVGQEGTLSFWGGSRILDPFGEPLAEAGLDEEELIVADLDYDSVRRARVQLPTVRDSNLPLIRRELDRLG